MKTTREEVITSLAAQEEQAARTENISQTVSTLQQQLTTALNELTAHNVNVERHLASLQEGYDRLQERCDGLQEGYDRLSQKVEDLHTRVAERDLWCQRAEQIALDFQRDLTTIAGSLPITTTRKE